MFPSQASGSGSVLGKHYTAGLGPGDRETGQKNGHPPPSPDGRRDRDGLG